MRKEDINKLLRENEALKDELDFYKKENADLSKAYGYLLVNTGAYFKYTGDDYFSDEYLKHISPFKGQYFRAIGKLIRRCPNVLVVSEIHITGSSTIEEEAKEVILKPLIGLPFGSILGVVTRHWNDHQSFLEAVSIERSSYENFKEMFSNNELERYDPYKNIKPDFVIKSEEDLNNPELILMLKKTKNKIWWKKILNFKL